MERQFILPEPRYLKIGDFVISFLCNDGECDQKIPLSGCVFYCDSAKEPDFCYILDRTGSAPKRQELLFGSYDFMHPCHVWKSKDGSLEWSWEEDKDRLLQDFHISPDWKSWTLLADNTDTEGARAFTSLEPIFSYAILAHDAIQFHGVVMEYHGKGIVVTAPSGVGKTTHTRMWRDHENALILNGDRALCRKSDGKWYAYGSPWFGSSGEYINRKVELSAVVVLEQAKENAAEQIEPFQAALNLMERVFAPDWEPERMGMAISLIDDIVGKVPVIRLKCLPDLGAVQVLKDQLSL